ncbi:sensor histidine kinase [Beijerinckia indica]|uniref:sensor histidine kinase n=1 Tax=Beijerinckia indica TaxID=533 RepID=UPI001FCB46BE|nr:ATP-binding protein [Beijerinckia indica]
MLLFALAAILILGFDGAARYVAQRSVLSELGAAAKIAASLRVAMLRNEIEKQRTLPIVLAQDPDVRATLERGGSVRLAALNAKLEALAAATRAGAIYLLDANGIAIAASNYRMPTSFVGTNYAFRPYFKRTLEEGSAEHFAFGTVSHKPGLYLTQRLDGPTGPLGMLIVKAEFDAVEAEWRHGTAPTFVSDERGIILVTSEPSWRFRTKTPIPVERRAEILANLQFGDAKLDLLPLHTNTGSIGLVEATLPGEYRPRYFVEGGSKVSSIDWTLHVLTPTETTMKLTVTAWRSLTLLLVTVALGVVGLWLSRQHRLVEERKQHATARRELENMVEHRTKELRHINERLTAEVEKREHAQIAVHNLQDELVQASKLAVLGQIAASVAHEVNQPVAAIRTFAENSQVLLIRGDTGTARINLSTIAGLTERIGTIMDELRAFSRKTTSEKEPISLRETIDGALLLVGHRLKQQTINLFVDLADADIVVAAERIRLEQVFVNLLQNAIEAVSNQPDGSIQILARPTAENVIVTIADNGPGFPDAVMTALFMPFTTTKPDGVGLGLLISHDILNEFNGTLAVENCDGATLTITLPRVN